MSEARHSRLTPLRERLISLYHGQSKPALRFQTAVLAVDLLIIGFFIATPILKDQKVFLWFDYSVAVILVADMAARLLACRDMRAWWRDPTTWLDVVILATLLFPDTFISFGFLRILRLWSISRSGFLWRPLRRFGYGEWETTLRALLNLVTFLFVATGFIYTFFFRTGSGLAGYIDALYFTVATVTTTGFGDITLKGSWGKLTSIVTMMIGISLFVRLAQALFRPHKITFVCPQCALSRHDPDAVHCKACGHLLKIPDEGSD